jgi:ABC-type glycerol-3-phosphate transport system permease component
MSHIAQVGRRSWRVRGGILCLYLILIAGAVTTVYPFLLMVSTAAKSQADFTDYRLAPRYLTSNAALFLKYAEDRYANNLDDLNAAHNTAYATLADVRPPKDAGGRALAADWEDFVRTLPPLHKKAGFGEHDNAPSVLLLRYREHLRRKFGNDIEALNAAWTEENASFEGVTPPFERTARREWVPDATPKMADWTAFKAALPPHFLIVTHADPLWRTFLREERYEDDLDKLNAAWGTGYRDWREVTLPRSVPKDARRADWEEFLRTKYPLRILGVGDAALPAWRRFLGARGRAEAASAPLPRPLPASGQTLTDWMEFVHRAAPTAALSADSAENLWRARLAGKYGTMEAANAALGTSWRSFEEAIPPEALADWNYARSHAGALRWEWATRNFRWVTSYILLHGRAVFNTVAFCGLAILAAVIVNPLCAYALSRYPLPYAYQVLLFLLATMAFPAEVAMIPNFLLLKELGMLNSFWALVLPGLASGFSIFLLKGFFDSLPKELYEAGILDGASELAMFRRITIPLSLPIFSVIALNAFTASYGAFLFALVVCQDPGMWTLMVWLYDLQASAPQYVIMAALTIAALPTLIVFLFAQKVILRGIILPSFK